MIVRISFSEDRIILFGNSYTQWMSQFREYAWRNRERLPEKPIKVEVSSSQWISWGGLKWTTHDEFQKCLNREGCYRESDPDNPKPRQYAEMKFAENINAFVKVWKVLDANAKRVKEFAG